MLALVALGSFIHQYFKGNGQEIIFVTSPAATETDSLQLRMHKEGWLDQETGERIYEFDLFNSGNKIAVVRSLMFEVLEIVPAPPPSVEAALLRAEYHILLEHDKRGDYLIIDEERKYGNGDIERFAIGVISDEPGWSYTFRIKAIWYEPEQKGERILYSDCYVARFSNPISLQHPPAR